MNHHTRNTIGVDISKAHLDAHELPSGRARQFDNNVAGITKLVKWISPDVDCVVYESTGPFHRALEETLAGSLPLARVNAARARRFAQAMGQEAKTDAVDAKVLARMGAALDLRLVEPPSLAQRNLAELKTARDTLTRDRTAVLNQRTQARHSLIKRQLKLRLQQIERQIKALNAEIGKLIAADDTLSRRAEILTSIPGVAEITAAALIAEMPELGQLDAKAAASLAGLAPVTRESGKWKGRSFIRGGRWRARRALFMATLTAITHNPDFARKYQDLRARGKPAKVALTAVMRKLLVLANALLQQDRLWSTRPVPESRPALEVPFRSWSTSALGIPQGHPKGRNEVEEPRSGLTLREAQCSGGSPLDKMDTRPFGLPSLSRTPPNDALYAQQLRLTAIATRHFVRGQNREVVAAR